MAQVMIGAIQLLSLMSRLIGRLVYLIFWGYVYVSFKSILFIIIRYVGFYRLQRYN